MTKEAPQRRHDPHEIFNALRWTEGHADTPTATIFASAMRQSMHESGHRAGYDGHKKRTGSKIHLAVDTLGELLALRVTPADAGDRAQVAALAQQVQVVTGHTVELGFVDQGYTGEQPTTDAAEHGIRLEVVKLPEAKRGFVLLPRRWVVERSFAWSRRFRRLARDDERLHPTLEGFHYVAFALLALNAVRPILAVL